MIRRGMGYGSLRYSQLLDGKSADKVPAVGTISYLFAQCSDVERGIVSDNALKRELTQFFCIVLVLRSYQLNDPHLVLSIACIGNKQPIEFARRSKQPLMHHNQLDPFVLIRAST